jgi:anti-anti-sigma regulatory factor
VEITERRAGVDYISSAGLRVLMLAAKEAKTSGGKIASRRGSRL